MYKKTTVVFPFSISCNIFTHNIKEQWIAPLVYWADSHFQMMFFNAAWTGQSSIGFSK